jgi:hypothetical protein
LSRDGGRTCHRGAGVQQWLKKLHNESSRRNWPLLWRKSSSTNISRGSTGWWRARIEWSGSTGDFIQRMVEAQMELEDQGFRVELTNMLPCDVMKAEMLLPRFAQALTARNGPRRKRKTA